MLIQHAGRQIVGELLGLGASSIRETITKLAASGDGRRPGAAARHGARRTGKGRTLKDAWREAAGNYRPVPGPVEYLRFLAANGYALSAIEQVVTGERRRGVSGMLGLVARRSRWRPICG